MNLYSLFLEVLPDDFSHQRKVSYHQQ